LIDEAEALLASGGSAAKPDTASSQHWVLAMDAEPKPHNLFCWLEVPQLTAARVLIGKALRHRSGGHWSFSPRSESLAQRADFGAS
jgi:hypothetical protein